MVMALRSKWAVGKVVRAGLALEGASRTSFAIVPLRFPRRLSKTGAGRNRRATRPPAHFQRNRSLGDES